MANEQTTMLNAQPLRALVIPASGWWIIQFIDHDMATVTREFERIEDATRELFKTQERRTREEGDPPWKSFGLAPEEFVERFNHASAFVDFAVEFSDTGRLMVELRIEKVIG